MTSAANRRGAASVGYLTDLPPIEAASIGFLRSWCDSEGSQLGVTREFTRALGDEAGTQAVRMLHQLCAICTDHGRRPLMRHGLNCSCLGADEACFANLISAGSEGAREDAMMLASLIVRVEMAPMLASLAVDFGMALRRYCLRDPGHGRQPQVTSSVLLH